MMYYEKEDITETKQNQSTDIFADLMSMKRETLESNIQDNRVSRIQLLDFMPNSTKDTAPIDKKKTKQKKKLDDLTDKEKEEWAELERQKVEDEA